MPAGVTTAAIAKAGDMSDEDLVGAERVAVWAAAGWAGHPPTVRGLRQVAEHDNKPRVRTDKLASVEGRRGRAGAVCSTKGLCPRIT